MVDDLLRSLRTSPAQLADEDKHWQEIESRMEASNRGGEQWISIGKATSLYATDRNGDVNHLNRSHGKEEELELGIALQSETETLYLQNDTDSGRYGNRLSPRLQQHSEQYGSVIRNSMAPTLPQSVGQMKVTDGFGESLIVQESFDELSDQNKEVNFMFFALFCFVITCVEEK